MGRPSNGIRPEIQWTLAGTPYESHLAAITMEFCWDPSANQSQKNLELHLNSIGNLVLECCCHFALALQRLSGSTRPDSHETRFGPDVVSMQMDSKCFHKHLYLRSGRSSQPESQHVVCCMASPLLSVPCEKNVLPGVSPISQTASPPRACRDNGSQYISRGTLEFPFPTVLQACMKTPNRLVVGLH